MGRSGSGEGQLDAVYICGNDLSGSIKYGKFLV